MKRVYNIFFAGIALLIATLFFVASIQAKDSGKAQQYLYSLETGETNMVSNPNEIDMYPNFEDLPK